MKLILLRFLPIALLATLTSNVFAETESNALECVKSASFFAPGDGIVRLNYAPDREVAVLHLALDVTPDFKRRTVAGQALIQFKPTIKRVQELKLDAVDLSIESVTSSEKIQAYQSTDEKLIITFAEPIPADKETSITIKYHAEPKKGLYFRTPEMGYKEGDTHCFSQGEEIEARHWYPCFDSPNEKFTSEMTCRVPEGMTVVSNGRLVSEEKDAATGLQVVHWSQEKPHANYLVMLAAGYFKKLEAKHKNVPLAFLTPPSEFAEATNSFRETDDIMTFLEQEIGVPFPWAKYDQICVNDFVAGGMENTSATTLTDSTLFTTATENLRSSESLCSHEMAHQWFGDFVTCKDWSHIWLNEGAATYYQVLYDGHKNGHDSMLYQLYNNARRVTEVANDTNAIVRRNYNDPFEMFGYLAYPKGGWVLHMLRSQLGKDLYRHCIQTYLERHAYGNVTSEDLRVVIEEVTGRSYDQFFDQWLYHAHYPEIDASYSWDEHAKLAKITIRQQQKLGPNVLLFDFPLTVRFKGAFGVADRSMHIKDMDGEFYFPLESAPEGVRLDPEYTLLTKTTFNLPTKMVYAQLADKADMMGRLIAIEQLGEKQDKESVAKLKEALNQDSFFGVRVEAARALRTIHTDDALTALLDSTKQPDARARRAVMSELGNFYRNSAYEQERKALDAEKNPDIEAALIRDLGAYEKTEVKESLLKFLASESFHNELAEAAVSAMRAQDDPAYLAPLMDALAKREAEFPSRGFGQGLTTLAYLARNEEKKEAVREFLSGHLNNKKKSVQLAAINALGTLGDPKAIAELQTFATASADSPERGAAERAVADLRSTRKPVDDFKNLRQEMLDLEKTNRALRKDLDALKQKLDAREVTEMPKGKKPSKAVKEHKPAA